MRIVLIIVRWLIVIAIFGQLIWVVMPHFSKGPPIGETYRRAERMAAWRAYGNNPNPATKAAFEKERKLQYDRRARFELITVLSVTVFDFLLVYVFFIVLSKKPKVALVPQP